jgi:hypothetical protein
MCANKKLKYFALPRITPNTFQKKLSFTSILIIHEISTYHKICIAFSGFGMPISMDNAMSERAAIDVLS